MYCRTCMHWQRPPQQIDSYGKVAQGICRVDGRQSHPTYTCADHEDFAATEGRLGLTKLEVLWLRANREHRSEATHLVSLYNKIIAAPHDRGTRSTFHSTLNEWRRYRPNGVLETHSKRGVATRNSPGASDESTHAPYQHPGQSSNS